MSEEEKKTLLSLARNTIAKSLGLPYQNIDASNYNEKKGAFVTLHKDNKLRGCIGYLISTKPLYKQIEDLAIESAFYDPRFLPLDKDEFPFIKIEISIMSEPKKINDLSEFVLSRDGIILRLNSYHSVFLPQVADETHWSKEEMLQALCKKAGLPLDSYKRDDVEFMTFNAEVFHDL
jgi:AmmeMemoRadiSam system protein A